MRDFLSFVRRPGDLLKVLRRLTVGGVIVTTGASAAPAQATAAEPGSSARAEGVTPTIVDRSRKAAKVLLQIPGSTAFLSAEHRSHRSHSSHRSHFSSSGGGGAAPRPAPSTPTRTPESSSLLDLTDSASAPWVAGEVVSINTATRTITIRRGETNTTSFAYRDDSKYETSVGVSVRFDDYAASNRGRIPVSARDKVAFKWRLSSDGNTTILSTIRKAQ